MIPKKLTKQEIENINDILDRQAYRRYKRKENISRGRIAETRIRRFKSYEDCETLLAIIKRTLRCDKV